MKTYTLDEVQDELIGKMGKSNREKFEQELMMDLKGKEINQTQILTCQCELLNFE